MIDINRTFLEYNRTYKAALDRAPIDDIVTGPAISDKLKAKTFSALKTQAFKGKAFGGWTDHDSKGWYTNVDSDYETIIDGETYSGTCTIRIRQIGMRYELTQTIACTGDGGMSVKSTLTCFYQINADETINLGFTENITLSQFGLSMGMTFVFAGNNLEVFGTPNGSTFPAGDFTLRMSFSFNGSYVFRNYLIEEISISMVENENVMYVVYTVYDPFGENPPFYGEAWIPVEVITF